MANVTGYVTVFESSDGGSGDPARTFWQFFVGTQAVTTSNPLLAETMRLAVETNSRVGVTFDPEAGKTMSQARIEFTYVCSSRKLERCEPPNVQQEICETIRYAPCKDPIPD